MNSKIILLVVFVVSLFGCSSNTTSDGATAGPQGPPTEVIPSPSLQQKLRAQPEQIRDCDWQNSKIPIRFPEIKDQQTVFAYLSEVHIANSGMWRTVDIILGPELFAKCLKPYIQEAVR